MLVMPKMPRWWGEAAGVVRYDGGAHEASLMVSAPLVWSREKLPGRASLMEIGSNAVLHHGTWLLGRHGVPGSDLQGVL